MGRIPQLDGLRGIAALMVFVLHAFGVRLLWCGVDLFFVMSGYLITGVLLRLKQQDAMTNTPPGRYWRTFYLRRARRILPPYFLFLLVAGIFFTIPWSHVWYWYVFFGTNIWMALGRPFEFALDPLWSLAVEEQFYLVWPFAVRLVNSKRLKTVSMALILVAPVLRAVCTPLFDSRWPIYSLPFFRIDTMAWGAFIAAAEHDNPSWISLHRPLAGAGALTAGGVLVALSTLNSFRLAANSVLFNALGYTLIGMAWAGVVTYVTGSGKGFVHSILSLPALRYFGKTSYTFYLYHLGVLLVLARSIQSYSLLRITAFLTATAIAAVSWEMLESPILQEPAK
jgi:peptidoglycan/LPS O-acetylase OafA/YrhL